MKKLLCLALALVMCSALFTGCGKFDMGKADLSQYIKLGDISAFPYEALVADYEAYREELSVGVSTCNLGAGYAIDFSVKTEILDENGAVAGTVDAWTKDLVEKYDVMREPNAFDYALIYAVNDANEQTSYARTVKIGEAFAFTMKLADDYADADLAGKTVKFTVTVKKVLQAVYTDSYITERLQKFYAAVYSAKEVIEEGDTLTMDFTGTIDGVRFDGGTAENYVIVVGEGGLIPGFEEQLIGHKNGETFDITVTFPEDYEVDPDLAGKEAVFTIEVDDLYNDSKIIEDNTPYTTMWELKYALRVESYITFALMDYVQKQVELIEYPEQLLKDMKKIYKSYVDYEVAQAVIKYANYGEEYSKKEMKEKLYPNGSDVTYVEEGAKQAAMDYMVAVAVMRELGMEYTDAQYQKDLEGLAAEWTEFYGETQKPAEMEDLYGKEILLIAFIETMVTEELMKRISDAPVIPG